MNSKKKALHKMIGKNKDKGVGNYYLGAKTSDEAMKLFRKYGKNQ